MLLLGRYVLSNKSIWEQRIRSGVSSDIHVSNSFTQQCACSQQRGQHSIVPSYGWVNTWPMLWHWIIILSYSNPIKQISQGNRGRRSPDNIEDFESDVPLQSDKRSVSSRRSESPTVTDSECQTARFEEQSVLSGNTEQTRQRDEELAKQQEMDRLESFKVVLLLLITSWSVNNLFTPISTYVAKLVRL